MEFTQVSSTDWVVSADSIASGKLDLLSVMIHEMGHALGLQHSVDGTMEALVQPGERHLPSDLETALLQNIRDAVTAKAVNNVVAQAAAVTQYQVVPNPTLLNPEFAGNTGWNTVGQVTFGNNAAVLTESPVAQTRLNQLFVLGEHDRFLRFTLDGLALDDVNGSPDDAFEVALIDANTGLSLLGGTGLSRSDALLNLQANGVERVAAQVTSTLNPDGSRTYVVDLSGIATGDVQGSTSAAGGRPLGDT